MNKHHVATACLFVVVCGRLPAQGPGPLPLPLVPVANPITPQKAVLGKMLFWEEQLSSNNRVACGTCHMPSAGGGDTRRAVHPGLDGVTPSADDTYGSPGLIRSDALLRYTPDARFGFRDQVTGRMTPTTTAAAWFADLMWDGRATSRFVDPQTAQMLIPIGGALESQALLPLLSPVEMGHEGRTWNEITAKLAAVRPMALATNLPPEVQQALVQNASYPALFAAAFGDSAITPARIAFALATYERSLVPDQTPWDQSQRSVPNALTPNQLAGMTVFFGNGRCGGCHRMPLFSSGEFRSLGLRPLAEDAGRQGFTSNYQDRGLFKVPSLRNCGLRNGFMHTGEFSNLHQVMEFYRGAGGTNLDNKDHALIPLVMTQQEIDQLVDFVQNALTDPRVAAQLPPFDRPTLYSERVPPQGTLFGLEGQGSGGRAPQMLAETPPNVGNADFRIGVYGGLGGAFATLALSLQEAQPGSQIQGVPINVEVWVTPALVGAQLGGGIGAPGQGYATIQQGVPNEPGLVGMPLYGQWFVWDPGVLAGASSSRGAMFRML